MVVCHDGFEFAQPGPHRNRVPTYPRRPRLPKGGPKGFKPLDFPDGDATTREMEDGVRGWERPGQRARLPQQTE